MVKGIGALRGFWKNPYGKKKEYAMNRVGQKKVGGRQIGIVTLWKCYC